MMIDILKPIVCPIEDYTCPYCDANGCCMIDNPYEECDDYATIYQDFFDCTEERI